MLATIIQKVDQRVSDFDGKRLEGVDATLFLVKELKGIFEYSGVTVDEVREALQDAEGTHKDEILGALDIIEKEDREKGLQKK